MSEEGSSDDGEGEGEGASVSAGAGASGMTKGTKGAGGNGNSSNSRRKGSKSSSSSGNGKPRLMLSYCWAQQARVLRIYAALTRAGYEVWLDIHNMSSSGEGVLQAMSAGVDQADLFLACVSREYSQSPNCRLEAEYAHLQRKKILFLMLQEDFTTPTGWLGILQGASLWYNFFDRQKSEAEQVEALVVGALALAQC